MRTKSLYISQKNTFLLFEMCQNFPFRTIVKDVFIYRKCKVVGSTGLSLDGQKKTPEKKTIQIKKKRGGGKLVKRIPFLGEAVTG